jgi:hydroxymethylpyrimidine/phosphomethylpyrimidine kinase
MRQPISLLTIAGSDSGGAAGLQADLKTWTTLGYYGMSAITAVTAQNSEGVTAVHPLPPDFIAAQIDAVLNDYGAAAIKTGFIGRVESIEAIADRLNFWRDRLISRPFIVVDPVLVNHRGEAMFTPAVADAYRNLLFPLADLVTPNRAESELLGFTSDSRLPPTASFVDWGVDRVLLKGIREGGDIMDIFWDGQAATLLRQPAIDTINVHGSGDTLSAAISAFLAAGAEWLDAVRQAQRFTYEAIVRGAGWRLGRGHGPVGLGPLDG